MTAALTPFLMFEGNAQDAIDLYVSACAATVEEIERFPDAVPDMGGKILKGIITIAGQRLRFMDSSVNHAFSFTPSISLFLDCESEASVDAVFGALSDGGEILMELSSDYPFAKRFGWCNDRFGVSWQISFS